MTGSFRESTAEELDKDLESLDKSLPAEVVDWNYKIDEDWSGDRSLFLYIILTDDAASKIHLRQVSRAIQKKVNEIIHPLTRHGLNVYFTMRSLAEHVRINDGNGLRGRTA